MTTGDICDEFEDLHRCTVMQHMGVLVEADLLIVERKGRERWNHLNPLPIKHIHDRWIGEYASSAVDLLARQVPRLAEATLELGIRLHLEVRAPPRRSLPLVRSHDLPPRR